MLRPGRTRRISSYERTEGNLDSIRVQSREAVDIARIEGAGVIRHIWFTLTSPDPMIYRNLVLRMYWDNEEHPSVEVPVGDFIGQGWGERYPYAALPICASPKRSGNIYLPMPFGDGAVVTLSNESEERCMFYYYIDYDEVSDTGELGRFHAMWKRTLNYSPEGIELQDHRTQNLTDRYNHVFLDAEGSGHYVGLNYFVDNPSPTWYGEGDDVFFVDKEEWPPSIHGTGTEDYFNSSYCTKEHYVHPYFGSPRVNNSIGCLGRTHCYRFHVEDPILFRTGLRGSIECGHANARSLDIVTVAYWYQTEPHKRFTPLPGRADRQNMPLIGPREISQWRAAWQEIHHSETLKWGHEPLTDEFVERMRERGAQARSRMAPPKATRRAESDARRYEEMLNRRPISD